MSESPDVSIVIVGLNARRHVLECIESIQAAVWRAVRYETIYVDNGSSDGSVDAVRDKFGGAVSLIANKTNVGFCPAANAGARMARGRYLYFINDDTLVVDDAIALLVEYMDNEPRLGTVGSRLIFPDGAEQYSGRRFPSVWNGIFGRRSFLTKKFPGLKCSQDYLCAEELKKGEPFDVDWVSAAGQCVRKEDFFAVGGYAEDYYYWHEAVFCKRLLRRGRGVVLHPKSTVIHYEGQGSGPRPLASQKFHIRDFHKGAFRSYLEWHGVRWFYPGALLAGLALFSRAVLLLAHAYARAYRPAVGQQEGGKS